MSACAVLALHPNDLLEGDSLLFDEAVDEADETHVGSLKLSSDDGDLTPAGDTANGTLPRSASMFLYPTLPSSLPSNTVAFDAMLPLFPEGGSAGTEAVPAVVARGGVFRTCAVSLEADLRTATGTGRSTGLSPLGSEVDEDDGPGLDLRLMLFSLMLSSVG